MFKVYHCNIQKTESCIFFPLSSNEQSNDIIVDKFLWRNSKLMKSVLLITLKKIEMKQPKHFRKSENLVTFILY